MIENLSAWLFGFDLTGWMGIVLYWVPLSICAYGYTLRTWLQYQRDLDNRNIKGNGYYHTITIGDLIGRGFATIIPVVNLWAAFFDVAPKLFSSFFKFVGRVFNQPLVPERKTIDELKK